MNIKRIIVEFFRPAKKCERLGHNKKIVTHRIRKIGGSYYRAAVTDYKADFTICRQCKKQLRGPENLREITWCTSCTMPEWMWDKIREQGYVIIY